GRDAVLVEVGSSAEAVSLAAWARDRGLARDVVPGASTVLLDGPTDRDRVAQVLGSWRPGAVPEGPEVVVPVVYDGPDLDFLADHWACSRDEVVRRHRAPVYESAFCGFAPGFAYLSGLLDDLPEVPRLASPRTPVPAGSAAPGGRAGGRVPG